MENKGRSFGQYVYVRRFSGSMNRDMPAGMFVEKPYSEGLS
ncbi:hypothetical protein [uncultured Bacteroides sp.]|nr:hypothetical protein [uncultured Bacteroides sp.]